ncbi:MAG: ribosome biogenesis GTPase Der [Rhodospirillaceae bacterium]|nr:ribosome biogenesis GTPase Der [Rhodospirillaceae bacterium]
MIKRPPRHDSAKESASTPAAPPVAATLPQAGMPKVALIGRPNVGKSTLFNRLVGQRRAIVHARPGVTRDRLEAVAKLLGGDVIITDTAGLGEGDDPLSPMGRAQTMQGIKEAAMVLLVVDGRLGVTPADEEVARLVRKHNKPTLLLVNKSEGQMAANLQAGLAKLGFGEPLLVSAEHGQGLHQLSQRVRDTLGLMDERELLKQRLAAEDLAAAQLAELKEQARKLAEQQDAEQAEELDNDDAAGELDQSAPMTGAAAKSTKSTKAAGKSAGQNAVQPVVLGAPQRPLKLAIIGRPNVGKSTLINALLGQDRLSVSPIAGTTRDAIALAWQWHGRPIELVDTAGLRRKTRVEDAVEYMAVGATLNAIAMAEVVVLLFDATTGLDRQDLQIARHVVEEGRVLVIAANKWDLIENPKEVREDLRWRLDTSFAQLDLPLLTISAAYHKNFDQIFKLVVELYDSWNLRLPTPALNRWLRAAIERQTPPYVEGRPLKFRYITQQSARPPQFLLFSNRMVEMPPAYQRYLTNSLRAHFKLAPVPIRWQLRTNDNPYD